MPRCAAVSDESGFGSGATGREGFWKGGSEPMTLSEKQSYSVGACGQGRMYFASAESVPLGVKLKTPFGDPD